LVERRELDEVEGGLITRYELLSHPDEHGQGLQALSHHQQLFGHPPRRLSGDRGVHSADTELKALTAGVQVVAIPAVGKISVVRQAVEHSRRWKRGYRWRAGIEGRIASLRRDYGLRKSAYHGQDGMERWIGLGVIGSRSAPYRSGSGDQEGQEASGLRRGIPSREKKSNQPSMKTDRLLLSGFSSCFARFAPQTSTSCGVGAVIEGGDASVRPALGKDRSWCGGRCEGSAPTNSVQAEEVGALGDDASPIGAGARDASPIGAGARDPSPVGAFGEDTKASGDSWITSDASPPYSEGIRSIVRFANHAITIKSKAGSKNAGILNIPLWTLLEARDAIASVAGSVDSICAVGASGFHGGRRCIITVKNAIRHLSFSL